MTNAAKHGALSVSEGRVRIETATDGHAMRIRWIEMGGPSVTRTQEKSGFGTIVLQQVLARDLRARVETDYRPEGLRFEIEFESDLP